MNGFLSRTLSAYDGADITIQMKARLFFWLCLVLMVLVPLVSGSAIYISWAANKSWDQIDPRLYVTYLMIFSCAVSSFVLLIRGHFFLSAHLIVISIIAGIFASVILERTSPICRLDSLILVVSLLSITPMIISRRRFSILLYGALALAGVYAFIYLSRDQMALRDYEVVDYLSDNTVAIVFVTIIAFALYTFNEIALSRARDEIRERVRSDEEKSRLEAQLMQAQRMESIGRLAGGIAHDFNNLLTAILGNTTLVMQKLPPEEREHERLAVVMKAAQSAAELTRQLLAFSRKQIIEPRLLDPAAEIGKMRGLLARLIGEDVELVINAEPGRAVIKADPGQLEQILFNLIVNARDAMPDGGRLSLDVSGSVLDENYAATHPYCVPGEHVMISVSDTGQGMSPEVQQHLFEPFFTTKPKGKGTGLGLATVYGAVKQNGGAIEVYSEVGLGTTFKIYFPRLKSESPETAQPAGGDHIPRGSETILLVEDSPLVLSFAHELLDRLGYHVVAARNGEEALAIAGDCGRIDLLLTDVIMPGMNGRMLADRLSRSCPGLRVLYASGYTSNVIVHHGVLEEGINFINKPYSEQALARKIREVLGKD